MFPACNECNLTLKIPNRKQSHTRSVTKQKANVWRGHGANNYTKNIFLSVVFHNVKSYDAHFVIKHFKKQYTARSRNQDDNDIDKKKESVAYGDIRVIPLNGKKYLSFQLENLHFIDSFQFLSTSLDMLVSPLLQSGRDKFTHTTKHHGDSNLVFAKKIYPYSWKLGLLWHKNYENYHDYYLFSDVFLLADVYQNFRKSVSEQHYLDSFHFITRPSLAWASVENIRSTNTTSSPIQTCTWWSKTICGAWSRPSRTDMSKKITRWCRGTTLPNSTVGSRVWTQITSMTRPCRSRCQ